MLKALRLAICLLLICFGVERALGATPTPTEKKAAPKGTKPDAAKKPSTVKKTPPKKTKTNAAGLLSDMEKAVAYIVKQAQAPAAAAAKPTNAKTPGKTGPKLDPKQKSQKPFWSGLKTVNTNVEGMKKALAAKSPDYFKLLDGTGRAVAQVNGSAQLMRVKDKQVLNGVKALATSYNELRKNFGKEAARKKKGGELTAKEKEWMAKTQAEVKKLQPELQGLHGKVETKKNPRLRSQVNHVSHLASKIARVKGATVNAYNELLFLVDDFSNAWYALGQLMQAYQPDLYSYWTIPNSPFDVYFNDYERDYLGLDFTDWDLLALELELLDAEAAYDIALAEAELAAMDAAIDAYNAEAALAELTAAELAAAEADLAAADADVAAANNDFFDPADDDDGDGIEDADDTDDDGDGVADDQDADDDNDGVADDDADGDGTADATDDDDDNDGTPDAQDGDDDGDGVEDDEADDDGDDDGGDDGGGDDDGGDDGGDDE